MLDPDADMEVHMGSLKLSWSGAMFDHLCGQMHMDPTVSPMYILSLL